MTTYHIHFFERTRSGMRISTDVADAEYVGGVNEFSTYKDAQRVAQTAIDDINSEPDDFGNTLCYQIISVPDEA